jgi:YesN/AraC family two-component response regulator
VRVVIADDEMFLREGLPRLLEGTSVSVVGKAQNAQELLRCVALTRPDVAIVDIRMPPTHTDEGLVAAREIRTRHPEIGGCSPSIRRRPAICSRSASRTSPC